MNKNFYFHSIKYSELPSYIYYIHNVQLFQEKSHIQKIDMNDELIEICYKLFNKVDKDLIIKINNNFLSFQDEINIFKKNFDNTNKIDNLNKLFLELHLNHLQSYILYKIACIFNKLLDKANTINFLEEAIEYGYCNWINVVTLVNKIFMYYNRGKYENDYWTSVLF